MTIHPPFAFRAALVFAFAVAGASGCSQPQTDIVATNTERVGDYDVVAARNGDALHASVCLSDPDRGNGVADRVLQQLMSRGYRQITLDLYTARQQPVQRVVWTPKNRTSAAVTGAPPQGFCQANSAR
jgi:hypothetical protein